MHARNPYATLPDFDALARSYPPLSQYVSGRSIDFHDDAAQRCLTQALMNRDFGLEINLPPDRLCPPVPNRLNYVLWIQDIVLQLQRSVPFVLGNAPGGGKPCVVRGLDIGTGASAIYPLLGCALEPTWEFVATELDSASYAYAQRNVRANALCDRVRVVKVEEDDAREDGHRFGFDRLLGGRTDEQAGTAVEIQFTMCNPPFYSSAEDIADSEARKEHSAFGVCTGAPVEMITPGGEARFVSGMIRESVCGRKRDPAEARKKRRLEQGSECSSPRSDSRPRWYTSMLGKMGSVVEVVGVLKELGITNYAITEFVQGHTRRWAVGWCVDGWRLSDDIARIANPNSTLQRLLPPRNTLRFEVAKDACLESVLHGVEGATVTPEGSSYVVCVVGDTWSRGARRKRKRGHADVPVDCLGLVSRIVVGQETGDRMEMTVEWLYGEERTLLESFGSHVARKMMGFAGASRHSQVVTATDLK